MSTRAVSSIALTWRRIRTVPGLGRNVLIITLWLAFCLAISGYLLQQANFQPPWGGYKTYEFEFTQAPATNPQTKQTVTVAGVTVGTVVGSRVTDRGTAAIKVSIRGVVLYDNARAVLRTVNPLNQMFIEINPGGPPGHVLPENGIIPAGHTSRPIQPDEVLQHLDTRSQAALTSLLRESDTALAQAPEQLPAGLRASDDTLVALRPVVAALQTRREKIAQLVTALSQIATATGGNQSRIAHLADATQRAVGVLAHNSDNLTATLNQLPGLNEQLRKALTATQGLTKQLNPTLVDLNDASGSLPHALERFTDTTEQLRETVDAARPVVDSARPAVADLKPFVSDTRHALNDFLPITHHLDMNTAVLTSYLTDIQAFVFNTSSLFGPTDARGPWIRGHVVLTAPEANAIPGQHGGYAPGADAGHPQHDHTPLSTGIPLLGGN